MERNRNSGRSNTSQIQRPNFPNLRPISYFELSQYVLGRKSIIDKINTLHNRFKTELDPLIKPIIRNNTEPYEILEWYYNAVSDILKSHEIDHNLDEYLKYSFYEEPKFNLSQNYDVDDYYGFGVYWINSIKPNYKNWLLHICHVLHSFGLATSWEFIDWYMTDYMEDEYEMYIQDAKSTLISQYKSDDLDWDEINEQRDVLIENILVKRENKIKKYNELSMRMEHLFRKDPPKRLFKPKSEKEKEIYDTILLGIELTKIIPNLKFNDINCYQNKNQADDGYLNLDAVYMMCTSWAHASNFVEYHIFEQYIDVQANQVGVCQYSFSQPEDEEFDPTDEVYDPNWISTLNHFCSNMQSLDRKYGRTETN